MLLVNSRTNQIADNRIADWSIRGLVNSLTGQLADNRIADWTTREPCTGQLADWLKFQFFYIATFTLTTQ